MSYTTADLINTIRVRGNFPTTTNTNNSHAAANILTLATEALHMELLPLIMSAREEFYVYPRDYIITQGQAEYTIPTRTTGQVVRDLQRVVGTSVQNLVRYDSEQITSTQHGEPRGFYLRHDKIVLHPTPASTTGILRVRYFLRPGRLAATPSCAQIASIDVGNSQVVVSSIPSSWSTGIVLDLLSANEPYSYLAVDQTTTSISSTTIQFSSLPDGLAVGDWLAPQGYSPIPQLPFEFTSVLAQAVVVQLLDLQGDQEAAKAAFNKLSTLQKNALQMITPRVQGEGKKIVSRGWRTGRRGGLY